MAFRKPPHPTSNQEANFTAEESSAEETSSGISSDPSPEMLRAYRTRGWLMPLCGILTAVIFCLTVPAWYGLCREICPPEISLLAGVLLSVVAIPFHILGGSAKPSRARRLRPLFYGVSILLNAMGSALCMTAYYVHIQTAPLPAVLFAAILPSAVLYTLTALLMQCMPHRYALLTGASAVLTLALIVIAIVFWVKNDNKVFFSFGFFNLLWTLISVIALHVACSDEESPALRFASFASFGILLGVAAIVLVILVCAGGDCDCDCSGDCCDCGDCGCGDASCGNGEKQSAHGKKKHVT